MSPCLWTMARPIASNSPLLHKEELHKTENADFVHTHSALRRAKIAGSYLTYRVVLSTLCRRSAMGDTKSPDLSCGLRQTRFQILFQDVFCSASPPRSPSKYLVPCTLYLVPGTWSRPGTYTNALCIFSLSLWTGLWWTEFLCTQSTSPLKSLPCTWDTLPKCLS